METTFITINDLSAECRILYSSDSVVDILGYDPEDVVGQSAWDFFHPQEVPLARAKHGRSIQMDKAAVLSYCRMKTKEGTWVGCEVIFTVVYNVLVGCTSVYRRDVRAANRAAEAPAIRRLFSPSPRDPRYHMLSHLSTKFTDLPPTIGQREPRAALFLNRYTRTLTIMYATDGLADVLGITGDELHGKSFYFCMQQQCLHDAVQCLENAKANDSIAYLRFWYQDPRNVEVSEEYQLPAETDGTGTEESESASNSPRSDGSGGRLHNQTAHSAADTTASAPPPLGPPGLTGTSSSGAESSSHSHDLLPGQLPRHRSSGSNATATPHRRASQPIQLEAVISCTSDGLVVCLRVASPAAQGHLVPTSIHPNFTPYSGEPREYVTHYEPIDGNFPPSLYTRGLAPPYTMAPQPAPVRQPPVSMQHNRLVDGDQYQQEHGGQPGAVPQSLYAVPWSTQPLLPANYSSGSAENANASTATSRSQSSESSSSTVRQQDFMKSIKEMAVFAWALVGINGALAEHGSGTPHGEAQPPSGREIWRPNARIDPGPDTQIPSTYVSGPPNYSVAGHEPPMVDGESSKSGLGNGGAKHETMVDGDSSRFEPRMMVDANLTDGETTGNPGQQTFASGQRTLPGFEAFKQGAHSPTETFRRKDKTMVDGVNSPPRDKTVDGNTFPSDRNAGVQATNQWGFGDPGLRSRGPGVN